MPSYDYFCPTNERTVEVFHPMSASVETWGQLAERAGLDLGDTPAEAPVEKLIRGSFLSTGADPSTSATSMSGPCCGPGSCGC